MSATRRLALTAALAVLAVAAVACDDAPTPVSAPGTVCVEGDSLTIQAGLTGDARLAAPTETVAGVGWTMGMVQADGRVTRAIAEGRCDRLVIALGHNGVRVGGWDRSDELAFFREIWRPHSSSCVVVVLPGVGAGATPAHAAEMAEARASLARLAGERPGTVTVDWQDRIDARPGWIAADGVHLVGDEAGVGYVDSLWSGVEACGS